ncbi:MAG TPA: hypothetical protein VEH10_01230 [Thermoplasmata archaeon]|nr:hypothetical protein [Thermoplasmata archaeon]
MPESSEQAEFRRHLGELRRAAGGLGRDFKTEFSQLDTKIERLGSATARDAKELGLDIEEDLASLGRSVDDELRRLPHRIAEAGTAIGSGTARAAGAAKDAMVSAGHKAKEGTKNALAVAAGVKRTPMKSWTPPPSDEASGEPKDGSGSS